MTDDDWDFFNKSVGKLEKEVIVLKKENAQLKEQCDNWYKSFEAKSKGLFETMKDCHSLVQLVLKLSPEHKGYLEKNYKECL